MEWYEPRYRGPEICSGIIDPTMSSYYVQMFLDEGIYLLKTAEEEGADGLPEILDLRKCIDKRLETLKLPDIKLPDVETMEEDEEDDDPYYREHEQLRYQHTIKTYQEIQKANITLEEYFHEQRENHRRFWLSEEEKKKEEEHGSIISEHMLQEKMLQSATFSYRCCLSTTHNLLEVMPLYWWINDHITKYLWKAILILIDAEDTGIEEIPIFRVLRWHLDKRLQTLEMPYIASNMDYGNYVEHYIKGYQTAKNLGITLPEYFNKEEGIIKGKNDGRRKKKQKLLNEFLYEAKVKGRTQPLTKSLLSAFSPFPQPLHHLMPTASFSTFVVDDVRMSAPMAASRTNYSFLKRRCVEIVCLSFAYCTRRMPYLHFTRRRFMT